MDIVRIPLKKDSLQPKIIEQKFKKKSNASLTK